MLGNLDHAEFRHALMLTVFDLHLGAPPRGWSADLAGTAPSLPLAGVASLSLDGVVFARRK